MPLSIGDEAPDIVSTTHKGEPLKLRDFRGKKNVVLYFYPGDFTPVCTSEACGFRDMYEELVGKGTEVIGVSIDSAESHNKFAAKYGLAFPLLSDPNKEIAKKYEAIGFLTTILGRVSRVTFVIDRDGKIAGIFRGELSAKKHYEGVRAQLKALEEKQTSS